MSNHFFYLDPAPRATGEGSLTGTKIAVQSNISVRDWPTTAGSVALENYTALEDATVVERIRSQGGVIVGSSRMSELGFGLRDDGGEAVLREGQADALILTDFLGESRITAAEAGVFGFKPTYGVVSRFGLIGLIPSMESYGLASSSPRTIAALMDSIAGPDKRDFSMSDRSKLDFLSKEGEAPRIVKAGIPAEAMAILTDDEKLIFRKGTERLAAYGIDVSEVSLPEFELFPVVHGVVGSVEASSSAGKYDGVRYGHRAQGAKNWNDMYLKSRGEAFGTLVKSYLFQGAYFQFENYEIFEKAGRIRARLVKGLNDLLDRVDALILPTKRMSFEARRAETVADVYRAFTLTLPANVAGLPALQLPGFLMNGTGDLGMQLIGPAFGDAGLLGLANLIPQQKGTN
ncbi:MAG TPA: amidase family protein [Syntrophales bacterium]|nr:amidase family protein [Syntrophales bacterium]